MQLKKDKSPASAKDIQKLLNTPKNTPQSTIQVPSRVQSLNPCNSKEFETYISVNNEPASVLASLNQLFNAFNIIQTDMVQLQYKPARLVIPTTSDRWYIIFYIYDVQCGQLKRKRFYDLPQAENKEQKIYLANLVCNQLNSKLASGILSDKNKYHKQLIADENFTNPLKYHIYVSVAVMRVIKAKEFSEERTQQTYTSIAQSFCDYIKNTDKEPDIESFATIHAKNYLASLLTRGLSPRTFNNHLLTLRTIWQEGIDLKFFTTNPWKEIRRQKCSIGKNIAYLPHQQSEILKFAQSYPHLLFLIRFMYYTLARTNEISQLQVKHIGMFTPDKIYIPASVSKNNHERHVIIPAGLEKEFIKYGIRKLNPEWYIFGKDKYKPGPVLMPTKRIGQKYREWILAKLKYPVVYTLYSWKHTGVIAAHKAGVSDDDIMLQTGHLDYGSFQKYLKSLSLYDNKEFALKIPEI
jgi:integrase